MSMERQTIAILCQRSTSRTSNTVPPLLFELGRREAIVTAIHPSLSLSARPFLLRPGEQHVHCHFSRFFFLLLQAGGFYSRTSQSPHSSFPPALCFGRRYSEGAAPHRRERSGTARSWQPSLSSPKVEVSLSPPGGLGLIHALRRTRILGSPRPHSPGPTPMSVPG